MTPHVPRLRRTAARWRSTAWRALPGASASSTRGMWSLPGHVRRLGRRRLVTTVACGRSTPAVVRDRPSRSGSGSPSVRQPRRGRRRGPRQGPGRHALRATRTETMARRLPRRRHRGARCPAPTLALSATGSSSRPARSSPATATSSRASPASTSRPSPASPPRSSASPAATAARSPAAPRVLSDRIVVRITSQARRDLHRPDDRPGRGRRPAEDAQRDRAEHPARRP